MVERCVRDAEAASSNLVASISYMIRPVGQAVKTTPSHGVNPGSIPGQVISYPSSEQKSMKIAEGDFHGFLLVAVNV